TYKRYALTDSGISPRSIPGQSNGMHAALSNEHDEIGREEAEDPYNRVTQMNKRFRKIQNLSPNTWEMDYSGPDNPDLLLLGWGSTYAQLNEARAILEKQGKKAAHLQLRLLTPFPHQSVKEKIQQAKECLIVENNYTAQLRLLIQREIGFSEKFISHNRYDGNPLTVNEIVLKANEVLQ
ncbi:MAG: 2-oxoacid:acceptor oxidoreductase subunit alpha, partial [Firmicutes bacterium]|nr:2-oxoacid:acceptor oxidoreductase subunit alpha [Bacillota bacterium]